MDASNKGKCKRSTPCTSSSYETDRCYSADDRKKRPPKKGKYVDEKGECWKGASVSTWNVHYLEKLGIHYAPKTVSLSEMLETVKKQTKWCVGKPFPSYMSSLEENTRRTLNFSLPVTRDNVFSPPDFFEELCLWEDAVCDQIKDIRKEESELLEKDDIARDLFDMWSVRIRDFMNYYKKFLADQFAYLPWTESRFVQLFMTFSRIFFLDPELGSPECRTIQLGKEEHSCYPDIRFNLPATSYKVIPTLMVMLTEVKQVGKDSLKDSEFDIKCKVNTRVLGQLGGELLAEINNSALNRGVLGSICIGTEVIFTLLDMPYDHFVCIKKKGQTDQHSSMISYTKPYNFLLEEDRNELLPFLFWLGYLQCSLFHK